MTTKIRPTIRRDQVYRFMAAQPDSRAHIRQIADAFGWTDERVRSILRKGEGKAFKNTRYAPRNWVLWTIIPGYPADPNVPDPQSIHAEKVSTRKVGGWNRPILGSQAQRELYDYAAAAHRLEHEECGRFEVRHRNKYGFTVVETCYTRSYANIIAPQNGEITKVGTL